MDLFSNKDLKAITDNTDEELVRQYQAGNRTVINDLLDRHQDNLNLQVRRRTGGMPVPLPAVHGKAMTIFINAATRFDLNAGVKFRTFLDSNLQGLNRFVHKAKSAVHLPENKSMKISKLQEVERLLTTQRGYPPEDHVLSDALGWSIPDVQDIRRKLRQKEFAASGMEGVVGRREEREAEESNLRLNQALVYIGLSSEEKTVYDYAQGSHGKPRLGTNLQISQKTGLPLSRVHAIRTRLARRISNL